MQKVHKELGSSCGVHLSKFSKSRKVFELMQRVQNTAKFDIQHVWPMLSFFHYIENRDGIDRFRGLFLLRPPSQGVELNFFWKKNCENFYTLPILAENFTPRGGYAVPFLAPRRVFLALLFSANHSPPYLIEKCIRVFGQSFVHGFKIGRGTFVWAKLYNAQFLIQPRLEAIIPSSQPNITCCTLLSSHFTCDFTSFYSSNERW